VRIGITGSHGVGKTTLLNALRSEPLFKDYKICNEVTREIKKIGLPINEEGNDNTQKLIMHKHAYNVIVYDNMITDRTALDCLIYSYYLRMGGGVTDETLAELEIACDKIIKHYDLIFYIRREFDIENDGVRSVERTFTDYIDKKFEEIYDRNKLFIVPLTGSVMNRIQQVLEEVQRLNICEKFFKKLEKKNKK
jgi:predicted ATPase